MLPQWGVPHSYITIVIYLNYSYFQLFWEYGMNLILRKNRNTVPIEGINFDFICNVDDKLVLKISFI